MKLCDPTTAAQALAEELGRPFSISPTSFRTTRCSTWCLAARSSATRVLPLFIDDDTVLVACVDEPDRSWKRRLRLRFGLPMRAVIATPLAINQGIAKYYAAGLRNEVVAEGALKKGGKSEAGKSSIKKKGSTKVRKRYRDLTPEEQHERKQLGYIIMCWGFVVPVLVDQFLLKGHVFPYKHGPTFFPFDQLLLSFFVPWLVIWWVVKEYWR